MNALMIIAHLPTGCVDIRYFNCIILPRKLFFHHQKWLWFPQFVTNSKMVDWRKIEKFSASHLTSATWNYNLQACNFVGNYVIRWSCKSLRAFIKLLFLVNSISSTIISRLWAIIPFTYNRSVMWVFFCNKTAWCAIFELKNTF